MSQLFGACSAQVDRPRADTCFDCSHCHSPNVASAHLTRHIGHREHTSQPTLSIHFADSKQKWCSCASFTHPALKAPFPYSQPFTSGWVICTNRSQTPRITLVDLHTSPSRVLVARRSLCAEKQTCVHPTLSIRANHRISMFVGWGSVVDPDTNATLISRYCACNLVG